MLQSVCTVANFFPRDEIAFTACFLAWERRLEWLWSNPGAKKNYLSILRKKYNYTYEQKLKSGCLPENLSSSLIFNIVTVTQLKSVESQCQTRFRASQSICAVLIQLWYILICLNLHVKFHSRSWLSLLRRGETGLSYFFSVQNLLLVYSGIRVP